MSTLETIQTHTPEQTRAAAAALGRRFASPVVLALHGELGSGKTCFVQGLADALGILEPVTSPTYTLIREYSGRERLVHVDLYRVNSPAETYGLGLEDLLAEDAFIAIEWAEHAVDLLPRSTIRIRMFSGKDPGYREIQIEFPD